MIFQGVKLLHDLVCPSLSPSITYLISHGCSFVFFWYCRQNNNFCTYSIIYIQEISFSHGRVTFYSSACPPSCLFTCLFVRLILNIFFRLLSVSLFLFANFYFLCFLLWQFILFLQVKFKSY